MGIQAQDPGKGMNRFKRCPHLCIDHNVSIQSIVQLEAGDAGAEIVVITHVVVNAQMRAALEAIHALPGVLSLDAHLGCL